MRLHLSLFQDVGILINGSVPDLAGSRVECEYGPGVSTSATVHLGYSFAQIQTCPLLPRENYQSILPGAGETEPIWLCTSHYLSTQYKYSYSVGFSFFYMEDVELYQNKCNFPFYLSKCTKVSVA